MIRWDETVVGEVVGVRAPVAPTAASGEAAGVEAGKYIIFNRRNLAAAVLQTSVSLIYYLVSQ